MSADWEMVLDKIGRGELNSEQFISDIKGRT